MKIESIIDDVFDLRVRSRQVDTVEGLMIHRVGVDHQTGVVLGHDGASIASAFLGRNKQFAGVAAATGGENAYTFFIGGDCGPQAFDGVVWQALPLTEVGYHARRFSKSYIGIGCVGDFRAGYKRSPSVHQMASLVDLCANLALWLGFTSGSIVGHGEIKGSHGGEKAPGRPAACPGDLLNLDWLRGDVSRAMESLTKASARERLEAAGLTFPPQ